VALHRCPEQPAGRSPRAASAREIAEELGCIVEVGEVVTSTSHGRIRVVFAVDLFNEGLDIPEIDTLLLLRPTESATLFLQQLGRGLRRTHGKSVLTVLDSSASNAASSGSTPR
jgi:ERCC4-related helicase